MIDSLLNVQWLRPELFERIGWVLLHFLWQGAAIAAVLAVAMFLLRRQTPSARYRAACLALLLMLAAPGVTFMLLRPQQPTVPISPASSPTVVVASSNHPARAIYLGPVDESLAVNLPASADNPSPSPAPAVTASEASAPTSLSQKVPFTWIVLAWVFGVAALSLWRVGGWLHLKRLLRRREALASPWPQRIAELARRIGICRRVEAAQAAWLNVPAVVGYLRPVILLPVSAMTGFTVDQLHALLAHELAHVRRRDYLVNLAQAAVETVLFYHPAVWWVSRIIRGEREHCCDDLAAAVCGDPAAYAGALAAMEATRSAPLPEHLAVAAWSRSSGLLQRVRRLLGVPHRPQHAPTSRVLAALVALACVCVPLAVQRMVNAGEGDKREADAAPKQSAPASPAAPAATRPALKDAVATVDGVSISAQSVLDEMKPILTAQARERDPKAFAAGALDFVKDFVTNRVTSEVTAAYVRRHCSKEDLEKAKATYRELREAAVTKKGNAEDRARQTGLTLEEYATRQESRILAQLYYQRQFAEMSVNANARGAVDAREQSAAFEKMRKEIQEKMQSEIPARIHYAALQQLTEAAIAQFQHHAAAAAPVVAGAEDAAGEKPRRVPAEARNQPLEELAKPPTPEDLKVVRGDYLIGRNDLLTVKVMDLGGPGVETVKTTRVSETGTVRLPFLDSVQCIGRSEAQLEREISKAYVDAGIIQHPQVAVQVTEARGRSFSVLGQVAQPGQYSIVDPEFRMLDALVMCKAAINELETAYVIRKGSEEALLRAQAKVNDLKALLEKLKTKLGPGHVSIVTAEAELAAAAAEHTKLSAQQSRVIAVPIRRLTDGDLSLNVVIRPGDVLIVRGSEQTPIRLVVNANGALTFRGERTTWQEIPKLIEKMPAAARARSTLIVAPGSDEMTLRQLNEAESMARGLAAEYGFKDVTVLRVAAPAASPAEKKSHD